MSASSNSHLSGEPSDRNNRRVYVMRDGIVIQLNRQIAILGGVVQNEQTGRNRDANNRKDPYDHNHRREKDYDCNLRLKG